jgi:hypothetical protein
MADGGEYDYVVYDRDGREHGDGREVENITESLEKYNEHWFVIFTGLFNNIEHLPGIESGIYEMLKNLFMEYALKILIKYDEILPDNVDYLSEDEVATQQTLKRNWEKNFPKLKISDEFFTYKNFADTIFYLILENDEDKNRFLNISQEKLNPYNNEARNDMAHVVREILKPRLYICRGDYLYECIRYGHDQDLIDSVSSHFFTILNDDCLISEEELENQKLRQEHITNAKNFAEQSAKVARDRFGDFEEASGGLRRRHKIKKTKKRSTARRRRSSKARKSSNSRKARKSRTTRRK